MNQKEKSRTDGHQAAPDFISAWVSRLHFTTPYCFLEEVYHDG